MPPTSRLEYLFFRYYEKSCTDAEKAELMQLLLRSENDAEVKALIDRVLLESKAKYHLPEGNAANILEAILTAGNAAAGDTASHAAGSSDIAAPEVASVPEAKTGPAHVEETRSVPAAKAPPALVPEADPTPLTQMRPVSGKWTRWAAAASIALAVCVGAYIWFAPQREEPAAVPGRLAEGERISPGGDRALLTLGDGTIIDLEAAENGRLDASAGTVISKGDGQLVYEAPPTGRTSKVVYNTITTPQGGQYEVVLPDGSHVWLNARSSLRFPTAFTGDERVVELKGEGYFEVSRDAARPFRVRSEETEVEVLGTHFNIKAYANEPVMETTLLEGAVKVSRGGESKIMQPGQQVQLSAGGMEVSAVDTSGIVAWKNGLFQFNNADLESIMRQLERWYDIRIDYASIPGKRYNGTVLRSSNLSEVLSMLEMAGRIRFEVKDRTVRVIN